MLENPRIEWFCLFAIVAIGIWLYQRRARPMRLVTIVDGDTFIALDRKGVRRKLRLRNIDSPELAQRNGKRAREFVQRLTKDRVVRVRLLGRDRYGRHLATVRVAGKDLALMLVREGLAYPLKGWRLRLAGAGAWLTRRGVHSGFGQAKPWEAKSRNPGLLRKLVGRR